MSNNNRSTIIHGLATDNYSPLQISRHCLHFIHLILEKQMCTLYNRTNHSMEFIIMCCVKNTPKSPIVTREVRDKDDEERLFPNFVHYSRPVNWFCHVYERLTEIVKQCLLLPKFEVVVRHGISEVTCLKFWDRWNCGCERARPEQYRCNMIGIPPAYLVLPHPLQDAYECGNKFLVALLIQQ
jgi:hypothetical protein